MHDVEAIEIRHLVVQYGDVRLQLTNQLEPFSTAARLADDIQIAALPQAPGQPITEERMIINDDDPGQPARPGVSPGVAHPTGRAGAYRTIG